MKKKFYVGALLAFLIGLAAMSVVPSTKEAMAADPVTLEVFDPTGAVQVSQLFSPRLSDLHGKTICELTNDSWEAYRTFPVITDLLKKQFLTANVIDYTKMPHFNERSSVADLAKIADTVKKAGCQAAIIGNAG
jgi:hypothetical protein